MATNYRALRQKQMQAEAEAAAGLPHHSGSTAHKSVSDLQQARNMVAEHRRQAQTNVGHSHTGPVSASGPASGANASVQRGVPEQQGRPPNGPVVYGRTASSSTAPASLTSAESLDGGDLNMVQCDPRHLLWLKDNVSHRVLLC